VSSVGHDLYRMLRAGMPPDWTAAERVVALILGDVCSDRTRTGFITNEQLCAESGLKPGSLRTILARLGAHGFEMRVELSKGSDGRPVYATSGRGRGGRAVDYRCPLLPPRGAKGAILVAPLEDAAVDNPPGDGAEGATDVAPLAERRNQDCERRNQESAPTPLTPQPSLPDQDRGIPPDPPRAEGANERSDQRPLLIGSAHEVRRRPAGEAGRQPAPSESRKPRLPDGSKTTGTSGAKHLQPTTGNNHSRDRSRDLPGAEKAAS
jgi:hypothetical protein